MHLPPPPAFSRPADNARSTTRSIVLRLAPELMRTYRVPGLACSIIWHGEPEILCFGFARAEAPVTPRTIFPIASASKPLAAVAMVRAFLDHGRTLDDPAWPLLHSWRPHPARLHKSDLSTITLRALLSHTAGFNVHSFPWRSPDQPLVSAAQCLDGVDGPEFLVERSCEPGRAVYSGGGITVAQAMTEDLVGAEFAELAQAYLLAPLQMTDSTFATPATPLHQLAARHDERGAPLPYAYRGARAASNLSTCIADLTRFLQLFHGAGTAILPPAILAEFLRPQPVLLPEPQWSLAWYMGAGHEHTSLKAGGSKYGVWTWIEHFPAHQFSIALLTNSENGRSVTSLILSEIRRLALGLIGPPAH